MDNEKEAVNGQLSNQATGTNSMKINQGTLIDSDNTTSVSGPEQGANSPVIDKLEVVLRSNQDVTVIEIDPHASTPQPKIEIKTLYTAEITCKARSTKGEPLTYEWQSTGGKIYGEGKKITWLAPGVATVYKITVTVTDSGGSSSAPVYISARCCY
ncbi:MAG: hypothetical protein EHM12_00500 [Dehalococcoidia bacterium]|nr:MAG: hypothetical protein EHM12_00500 [Dehalococcoidia bacterium]